MATTNKDTFGEEMNLLGQIEALLRLELEIQTKRQILEKQLEVMRNG